MKLDELLGPLGLEEAIAAIIERRFLHLPCGGGERLTTLLGWDSFVSILNLQRVGMRGIRVFKDGRPIPLSCLTGSRSGTSIDGSAFNRLSRQGVSVILNRLEHRSKDLHGLWCEAREGFACPAQLAYVANFGPGYALNAHFDRYDIIVVQVAGLKEWEILGDVVDVPDARKPTQINNDTVTHRFVMSPGDVMVLPYGLAHRCKIPDASLQLGILLERPHGCDYVKRLGELASERPELRRPAPINCQDEKAMARYEQELRQAVVALMDAFGPREFLLEEMRAIRSREVTAADLPPSVALDFED